MRRRGKLGSQLLERFGPEFQFGVIRVGDTSSCVENDQRYGFHLPHIMEWYWDAEAEEKVFFGKDGKECMRYGRRTEQYVDLK